MKVFKLTLLLAIIFSTLYYVYSRSIEKIWYIRTTSEELICWGNNVCGWSWANSSKYDTKLIVSAGMLQKSYPDKVIEKKLLLTIPKQKNSYSPITNFRITQNNIYLDVSIGQGKFSFYQINKKNQSLKKLRLSRVSTQHILSSISPSETKLLISYYNIKRKSTEFVIYDLANDFASLPSSIDTFDWRDEVNVDLGVVNQCKLSDVKHYICPITLDLLNCPNYPKVPSPMISKMSDPLELFESLHLDIPSGWEFTPNVNFLKKEKSIIRWSSDCVTSKDTPILANYDQVKRVDGEILKIKIFNPPKSIAYSDLSLLSQAKFEIDNHYYYFELISGSTDSKINKNLFSQFTQLLNSIKFNKNHFEQ